MRASLRGIRWRRSACEPLCRDAEGAAHFLPSLRGRTHPRIRALSCDDCAVAGNFAGERSGDCTSQPTFLGIPQFVMSASSPSDSQTVSAQTDNTLNEMTIASSTTNCSVRACPRRSACAAWANPAD